MDAELWSDEEVSLLSLDSIWSRTQGGYDSAKASIYLEESSRPPGAEVLEGTRSCATRVWAATHRMSQAGLCFVLQRRFLNTFSRSPL